MLAQVGQLKLVSESRVKHPIMLELKVNVVGRQWEKPVRLGRRHLGQKPVWLDGTTKNLEREGVGTQTSGVGLSHSNAFDECNGGKGSLC